MKIENIDLVSTEKKFTFTIVEREMFGRSQNERQKTIENRTFLFLLFPYKDMYKLINKQKNNYD